MKITGKYRNGRNLKRVHVNIAESAIGKSLPGLAEVHHVDGNRSNNVTSNLVICPSPAYHQLLHIRTDALEACGNANWKKCKYCKEYDDPEVMAEFCRRRPNPGYYHRKCHSIYENARRARQIQN